MENRFVTREEAVKLIRDETGIPVSLSRLEKDGAKGQGPAVAARYGRRLLYRPDVVLEWAQAQLEPVNDNEKADAA